MVLPKLNKILFLIGLTIAQTITVGAIAQVPNNAAFQAQPNPSGTAMRQPLPQPVRFQVTAGTQTLNMLVNTTRIVTLDRKVARLLVNNSTILRATPLSPNQIQVAAISPGITTVNLWDENDKVYAVDVMISGDARQLDDILQQEFPQAQLRVRPLNTEVMISGFVPQPEMVATIERIALNFYSGVINRIEVGGVQQILLKTKVIEVSRTKLRRLGADWAYLNGNDSIIQTIAGLTSGDVVGPTVAGAGSPTIQFGLVNGSGAFYGYIEALQEKGVAKILAEPSLMTVSGRAARFNSGGEFPIIVPQAQGSVTVDFREFGTIIDFVPVVLGNGRIHLEVRPVVSALDPASGVSFGGITVPGLKTRSVDTAVEMDAGQTFALAGLLQTQTETTETSIPWLGDLPWIGAAFRRKEDSIDEVELVILVTPEFVGPMNSHEVPPCGPGQFTTRPTNPDFYFRGYMEVPDCNGCGNCVQCQHLGPGTPQPASRPLQPQPASLAPTRSYNQDVRSNPTSRRSVRATNKLNSRPAVVGPIGYDVIK